MSAEFELVQKYLGIPYKLHGRDMSGLDCWGLILLIYRELGHELLDIESYDPEWHNKGADYFAENYHKQWEKVEVGSMYDVVLFRNKNGVTCHAGLILREGNMLHCGKQGVVVTRVRADKADRILDGVYRIKK